MALQIKRHTKIDELFTTICDSLGDGYCVRPNLKEIGAEMFFSFSGGSHLQHGINLANIALEKNKDIYHAFHLTKYINAYFVNDLDEIINQLSKYIELLAFK